MNQAEFIKTITPFKDRVFRLAKRLLVSTEEAEDATQEVLVRLWNNRAKLSTYSSVEALAMTITKNYSLDRLKSKQATEMRIVHSNYNSRDAGLYQQAEDRDSWQWVLKIMQKLPEQQKLILQMREVEQYEFEEIARIMDMNETAVRVALSRARRTLREELTKTHSYGIKDN